MDKNAAPSKDAEELTRLAFTRFGKGRDAGGREVESSKAEADTRQAAGEGHSVIFNAAARVPANDSNAKISILQRVPGTNQWDLISVRGSTRIKPDHIDSLSYRFNVFSNAGYSIRKASILHVDNTYVMNGPVDAQKLFKEVDVTDKVKRKQAEVDNNIATWRQKYEQGEDAKNANTQKPHPVELLVEASGKEHVDYENLGKFMQRVQYPLYYLDYETIQPSIPAYAGTKPYQIMPFQFSLHIQHAPGAPLIHHTFLHKDRSDPREEFAKTLVALCGKKGSVIVYNQEFESQRNRELALAFPHMAKDLIAINARMIDLYDVFQHRWMYHPDQKRSGSLKAVLPAYTNLSYAPLQIHNGLDASNRYLDFVKGWMKPEDEAALWPALEEYCGMDTYAMVELLAAMQKRNDAAPGKAPGAQPPAP